MGDVSRDCTPCEVELAATYATSPPRQRILFVDDEPQLQRLGRRVLSHLGYEVSLAGDGDEALDAFHRGGVDAIVTDLSMPRMDGAELVRRLRQEGSTVPVVLCTGRADELASVDEAKALYADVVRKPFDSQKLATALAEALATNKQRA